MIYKRSLFISSATAICIGLVSFASSALAGGSTTRDGFWTKGVQGSPDLEACKQTLAQHPNDAIANNDYGWALRMNGQLAEAAKYLHKAISINSSMSQPYSNLSVVMLEMGDVAQAVTNAHKAVALDPSQPVYHVVLGNALTKQHNLDEAIEQYQEALRFKSNYENAHYHLAEVLALKGDNAAAQQELSTAISLDNKDERATALLDKLSSVKPH